MIELSNLVSAIQASVQRAADALSQTNYESLQRYFVDTKEPVDAKKILQDALREAADLSKAGSPEEVIGRLAGSLKAASAALNTSASAASTALQPKLVAIDYPMATRDGPAVHTVHVPLITLSPFVGTQISKLTFKADLDVHVTGDGVLQVSFPASGSGAPPSGAGGAGDRGDGGGVGAAKVANTSIEIVVESTPASDGLRKVIEGYERALRAQIPG